LFAAESGFAAGLYDFSRNMVHEFVVLSRHCLEGGQATLETMLQERLVGVFCCLSTGCANKKQSLRKNSLSQLL